MEYPKNIRNIDSSVEFFNEVNLLIEESKKYIESFPWCGKIHNGWLYTNLGYVLCIFLYEIDNLQSPQDNLIWIIVGDMPPMYLDTYNILTTKEVIDAYIQLVSDWIQHIEEGKSLDECFPIQSSSSPQTLLSLKKRIELLRNKILPAINDIQFTATK